MQQLTDPATLVGHIGRPVHGFVFAPKNGSASVLRPNGKPTVLVVFASWCAACAVEMPRIVVDASAFGDTVNFIGIDYDDSPQSADAFIARNHVTFPTERFDANEAQNAQPANVLIVHVPGGRLTSESLEAFKTNVTPQTYAALVQIAQAQQTGSPDVASLERRLNVYVEDVGTLPAGPPSFALPHSFLIDGKGVLRDDIVGYDTHTDQIRSALERLGIQR